MFFYKLNQKQLLNQELNQELNPVFNQDQALNTSTINLHLNQDQELKNQQKVQEIEPLKILLICSQKLGIPVVTRSLAFFFFHRLNQAPENLENIENKEICKILAALSLAMKINEHVKRFKEISSIVLQAMDIKDEIPNLKDEMMIYELILQEHIYFNQEWDSPFRFLLKILADLGGDEKLAKRAWKITNQSYFCNVCIQFVPQAIAFAAIYLAWRLETPQALDLGLKQSLVSKYFTDVDHVKNICIQILNLYQKTEFLNSDDKMKCLVILEEMQNRKSRESSNELSQDHRKKFENLNFPRHKDRKGFPNFNSKYGSSDQYHKRQYPPSDHPKEYRHSTGSNSASYGHRSFDNHKYYSSDRNYSDKKRNPDSYESSKSSRRKYSSSDSYDSEDDYKKRDYRSTDDRDGSRSRSNRDSGRRNDHGRDEKSLSRSRHSSGWNNESTHDSGRKSDHYRDDRQSSSRRDGGSSYNSHAYYSNR